MEPEQYVCIIHDKMDQKKTSIPRLDTIPKDLDVAWQPQVSLIGAITHKHGEDQSGCYVLNGLWPCDPNLTIGSLALCLHNLERMDRHEHGDLNKTTMQGYGNSLFDALMSKSVLDFHKMHGNKENIDLANCEMPSLRSDEFQTSHEQRY